MTGRKIWLGIMLAAHLLSGVMATLILASPARAMRQVFHTQKVDIVYEHQADLEELARRLGAADPDTGGRPDLGRLALKIDGMLHDISSILQKWPLNPVKLTIRLLRDGFQVQRQQLALRPLPKKRQVLAHRPLESFYDPYSRTIYLSLADVRLGIVAHEMTHFILCESYPQWPGKTFQESLAQYIEQRFNAAK